MFRVQGEVVCFRVSALKCCGLGSEVWDLMFGVSGWGLGIRGSEYQTHHGFALTRFQLI